MDDKYALVKFSYITNTILDISLKSFKGLQKIVEDDYSAMSLKLFFSSLKLNSCAYLMKSDEYDIFVFNVKSIEKLKQNEKYVSFKEYIFAYENYILREKIKTIRICMR